ncbi:MAG: hypothetical protein HZC24_00930 [Rhodocyclales bacterium]|nr:hypothetical protein [Rhodocyclales bacterium]
MNLGALIDAVQRNCDIADARHAREMTMCNYLLEMREFYRWEAGLPPAAVPGRAEVGQWLAAREARWEELADAEFGMLPAADGPCDPFAVAAVNRAVAPRGLVYGAGIGRFGRPHFFLGRRESASRVDGIELVVSACEYARDLAAIPALLQGDAIVVRREALRQWLWEKAEAWGVKEAAGPLRRALAAYGYFDDTAAALERMTEAEIASLVLHERGEHAAGRALGPAWEDMLTALGDRRAELLARAVRDHWADCLVTLPALVAGAAWPALHFWCANLEGMRRALFPRAVAAGEAWAANGDASPLLAAATAGAAHWASVAQRLLAIHREHGAAAGGIIAALTTDLSGLAL